MVDNCPDTDYVPHVMDTDVDNVWAQRSAVDVLRDVPATRQLYLGEDGETDIDDFEEMCDAPARETDSASPHSPVVDISPEKYHSLF